jgi:tetratricopeptide (TPR) repeat protein
MTMTQDRPDLFHSRSSTQEFLLSKTDSRDSVVKDSEPVQKDCSVLAYKSRKPLELGSEDLTCVFPDLLTGNHFLQQAMGTLKTSKRFGAIVIRIDDVEHQNPDSENKWLSEIRLDVAETIEKTCTHQKGIWGQLGSRTFGSFFAEKGSPDSLDIARKIQKELAKHRTETVTAGIAQYPTANFNKNQVIDNARKALQHASFFGPNSAVCFDAVSLNISGDQLYQEGNIQEAIKEFKRALLLDPSNVNIHNSLGVCYGVLGEFENALASFETARWLDPDEMMAVYNIGLTHSLTADIDKSLEYLRDAYRINPEVFEITFQIGRLHIDQGQPAKALPFLEKAVRLRPTSGPAQFYLGEGLRTLDRTEEAIRAFQKAIKQNPNDAASLSALGCLFLSKGENLEIARVFCQQSVEISPENGLFRHRLAGLYMNENRLRDALEEFKKANQLGHDSLASIEEIQKRLTAKAS